MVYLPAGMAVTRPSTNPAWRRVTSLIELNALPLRHATNQRYQPIWFSPDVSAGMIVLNR